MNYVAPRLFLLLLVSCQNPSSPPTPGNPTSKRVSLATAEADPNAPAPDAHGHHHKTSYKDICIQRRCGDSPCPPTVCTPLKVAEDVGAFATNQRDALWSTKEGVFHWDDNDRKVAPVEAKAFRKKGDLLYVDVADKTRRFEAGNFLDDVPAKTSSTVCTASGAARSCVDLGTTLRKDNGGEKGQRTFSLENGKVLYIEAGTPRQLTPESDVQAIWLEGTMFYVAGKSGLTRYPVDGMMLSRSELPLDTVMFGVKLSESKNISEVGTTKTHILWKADGELFVLAK